MPSFMNSHGPAHQRLKSPYLNPVHACHDGATPLSLLSLPPWTQQQINAIYQRLMGYESPAPSSDASLQWIRFLYGAIFRLQALYAVRSMEIKRLKVANWNANAHRLLICPVASMCNLDQSIAVDDGTGALLSVHVMDRRPDDQLFRHPRNLSWTPQRQESVLLPVLQQLHISGGIKDVRRCAISNLVRPSIPAEVIVARSGISKADYRRHIAVQNRAPPLRGIQNQPSGNDEGKARPSPKRRLVNKQ